MRHVGLAALVLCATALSGCGSDAEPVWGGPPEAGSDGVVAVDGFAEYERDVDEPWERSPALAAGVFLRLDERTSQRLTVDAEAGPEGGGGQTVTVTLDGLPDDSLRGERWTLAFAEVEGGAYTLTEALRELRCRPGRGHEDYAAGPCV